MQPQVNDALWDMVDFLNFSVMGKAVSDHQVVELENVTTTFLGNLQPQTPQQLLVKPEGQRSWIWWMLWTEQELMLDWIVMDQNLRKFRVMSKYNWQGYYQYELRENPTL